MRQILDSGTANHSLILDCEIQEVVKLDNSKSTWVAKLVDPGTSEKEPRSLEWLMHQKYIPLMANATDTLKKSTSRGFVHTLAQSRSITSYTGERFFVPKRELKICGPRVHQQWTLTGPITRLLPNETVVVIMQKSSESEAWQGLSAERIADAAKTAPAKISFKAVILSVPSGVCDSGRAFSYLQPSVEDTEDVDIVLGDFALRPVAMLRLPLANRLIATCLHERDVLCLHNALIVSQSQEFTWKRTGLLSSEESDSPSVRLTLPLLTYAADSLAMLLSHKTIEKEEKETHISQPLNLSLTSTPLDYRFHGPKFTPILLRPSCNNITIAGYVMAVFPRQAPKSGYRRYGFRLQGTQTSDTSDVTVWEDLDEPVSMTCSIRAGHLVLIQGLFTVDRGDDIVLANIAKDGGSIANLSILEGILASHPDLAAPHDIQVLTKPPPDSLSVSPRDFYGPFVLFDCTVAPCSMTLMTSLHHKVCGRSVGQPTFANPLNSAETRSASQMNCKFCNCLIEDWKSECSWEFEVEWNITAHSHSANSQLTIKASACNNVSAKLLNTTARAFVLLSEVEQGLAALHRAAYPALGRICISRQSDSSLHLDQFIPSL